VTKLRTFDGELVGARSSPDGSANDWRAHWRRVLEQTKIPEAEIPINAVAWAFELFCRAGVELERVMLFVQAVWARFAREIGPVVPHVVPAAPAVDELPRPPSPRAPRAEHAAYERELERMIGEAQQKATAASREFEAFVELVNAAGEAFGDPRAWHVNVLGVALEVLYRRGYTDLELANLVTSTWEAVAARELERRESQTRGPRFVGPGQGFGFAQKARRG
jgi:hypothetical protein